jgi:hypothetical protein
MLQGVEAKVGQPGDVFAGGIETEDATFVPRPVEIAGV